MIRSLLLPFTFAILVKTLTDEDVLKLRHITAKPIYTHPYWGVSECGVVALGEKSIYKYAVTGSEGNASVFDDYLAAHCFAYNNYLAEIAFTGCRHSNGRTWHMPFPLNVLMTSQSQEVGRVVIQDLRLPVTCVGGDWWGELTMDLTGDCVNDLDITHAHRVWPLGWTANETDDQLLDSILLDVTDVLHGNTYNDMYWTLRLSNRTPRCVSVAPTETETGEKPVWHMRGRAIGYSIAWGRNTTVVVRKPYRPEGLTPRYRYVRQLSTDGCVKCVKCVGCVTLLLLWITLLIL
eukprot:Blabericola_migrator_1__5998@NODE_3022_length_2104_cov_171_231222_g1890_i0_p1_GENE_NODE_3022_length_2104_cov_171_231222_g1890_i0NODE_3022_length_2104_cov_171_231222_g1890_i0_p1_ORF_typecomplete_len292_score44_90_NODE_3022_length_2104_cov_171_231222_g1890_i03041179